MTILLDSEARARAEAHARATKGRVGYVVYRHKYLPSTFQVSKITRHHRIAKHVWAVVIAISPTKIKS